MQARVGASQKWQTEAKNGRLKASKLYLQAVYARRSRTVIGNKARCVVNQGCEGGEDSICQG
ncbi:hypothetical protein PVK06_015265 [Gossypium arboreum]|uniref:Uncharacterized protein n=1 Tax=Gossypium arboreum TaxID=29729 RepID=A0ABR0PXF4_GOSAR|nr:hypothetical protein PVK06_015265 [Gossypium arboreum]